MTERITHSELKTREISRWRAERLDEGAELALEHVDPRQEAGAA